jgi:DNA-binding response OmpR family regulator
MVGMATILVVDDERPLRNLLAQVFADSGHRALLAVNGRQALDLLRSQRPDLVLADVMMPEINGIELCKRIKESSATAGIPVILMSAAGAASGRQAPADAFLHKPFDLDDVDALVQRLLPSGDEAAEKAGDSGA